jgi:drug/metabolite transporter (DMT)-like permease
MFYILLAVASSVLVSVLLRVARRAGVDVGQAIAGNYIAASALTWLLLRPALPSAAQPASIYVAFVGLGILLPGIFYALARSVQTAGIVRSEIAQRLSLLVSLLAAALLFGDVPNAVRLIGMALGFVAILCTIGGRRERAEGASGAWPWLVFVGFGAIDVLLKLVAQGGQSFPAALLAAFILSFIVAMAALLLRRTRLNLRSLAAGLVLGMANFANIYCYIRGHQALATQPSLVFSMMNIGVVLLGALVGIVGFGERPGRLRLLGLLLAVVAIGVLALA